MIMGIDPGVSTGFAFLQDGEYFTHTVTGELSEIWSFLHREQPKVISFEDFKFRPQMMKVETYSLEVKGVVKLWAGTEVPIFYYLPAAAKAFWSDDKIKKLGLWKPGHIHEMDALRVLLTHRMSTEADWTKRAMELLK